MRKIRKHRGRKNCGGHKKKRRGAGNRGGRGRAGVGKRIADTRPVENPLKPKDTPRVINLGEIDDLAFKKGLKEVDVSNCKVLGEGQLSKPLKITALKFSKSALEKIKEAKGEAKALQAVKETVEEETSE